MELGTVDETRYAVQFLAKSSFRILSDMHLHFGDSQSPRTFQL
jgi:hypothetical protein